MPILLDERVGSKRASFVTRRSSSTTIASNPGRRSCFAKISTSRRSTGYAADEFLQTLSMIHGKLAEQKERLAKAGNRLADAARAGKQRDVVAVGHGYPMILELEDPAHSPLGWNPSISDLRRSRPEDLSKGDVAIHFGYSPVKSDHVKALLNPGIRLIYSSPYGRPATLHDHPNLIWLDLPWRPADATVDIPGYSVRMLPMSSSAHTMAYFAIVCEMADKMGWV